MESKWFWGYSEEGRYSGPFESREDALKDAAASCDIGDVIFVGTGYLPDPGKYAALVFSQMIGDIGELLYRMNEQAYDNEEHPLDTPQFEFSDGLKQADAALKDALRRWAEQHVQATAWVISNPERIVLPDTVGRGN